MSLNNKSSTSPPQLYSRRAGMGVRPVRQAVLVNNELPWSRLLELVTVLTGTWGGFLAALVPSSSTAIDPRFYHLLAKYDPDVLRTFGFKATEELRGHLLQRFSILPHFNHIIEVRAGFPFSSTVQVARALTEDRKQEIGPVSYVTLENGDDLTELLVASLVGKLSRHDLDELREFWPLIQNSVVFEAGRWASIPDSVVPYFRSRPLTLRHLTTAELTQYGDGRDFMAPVLAVCGDTVEDFCLFWTLRALTGPGDDKVFWIPSATRDLQIKIGQFLPRYASHIHAATRELEPKAIVLLSSSIPREGLNPFREQLGRAGQTYLENPTIEAGTLSQLDDYLSDSRTWEINNSPAENRYLVQLLNQRATTLLPTPVPKNLEVAYDTHILWMVDVDVESFRPPIRSSLSSVLGATPGQLVRASKDGISFFATRLMTSSYMTRDSITVRPELLVPDDRTLFLALFKEQSLDLEPSDKGNYEREWITMAGGLSEVARQIINPHTGKILSKFRDEKPNTHGEFNEGVVIAGTRYLDFDAVRALLGNTVDVHGILNDLLQAGILSRGIPIKCPRCLKTDWYPFSELSDAVTCHRCGRSHVFTTSTYIFFRLDPVVLEAIRQRSVLTLATLDHLITRAKNSAHFETASLIRKNSSRGNEAEIEIDFLIAVDGRVGIGESKTERMLSSRSRQQIRKLLSFAKATGFDFVVVSTGRSGWDPSDLIFFDEIKTELNPATLEIITLTGQDLKLPECWIGKR